MDSFSPFILYRTVFSRMVLIITVVTTLSSFVKPTANAYALNCFALHILYSLSLELKRYTAALSCSPLCFYSFKGDYIVILGAQTTNLFAVKGFL